MEVLGSISLKLLVSLYKEFLNSSMSPLNLERSKSSIIEYKPPEFTVMSISLYVIVSFFVFRLVNSLVREIIKLASRVLSYNPIYVPSWLGIQRLDRGGVLAAILDRIWTRMCD